MRSPLGFASIALAAFIGTTPAANAAYQVLALIASNDVVPLDCRGGDCAAEFTGPLHRSDHSGEVADLADENGADHRHAAEDQPYQSQDGDRNGDSTPADLGVQAGDHRVEQVGQQGSHGDGGEHVGEVA